MYKFLSTGLVLIGALLLNASAVASQDCDNYGANMQSPYAGTDINASTSCINDDNSSEWFENVFENAETLAINSLDQSATCIAANCRSRLKPAPTNSSTPEMTISWARPLTVISSMDQSATCVVANCRSRLQPAPSHPSV